jgi:hypothetical protein
MGFILKDTRTEDFLGKGKLTNAVRMTKSHHFVCGSLFLRADLSKRHEANPNTMANTGKATAPMYVPWLPVRMAVNPWVTYKRRIV